MECCAVGRVRVMARVATDTRERCGALCLKLWRGFVTIDAFVGVLAIAHLMWGACTPSMAVARGRGSLSASRALASLWWCDVCVSV